MAKTQSASSALKKKSRFANGTNNSSGNSGGSDNGDGFGYTGGAAAAKRPSGFRSFSFIALKQAQTSFQPSPITFKNLPSKVFDLILADLAELHLGPGSGGCQTCYLRDLHALSLTCRAWERAVRTKLYGTIQIQGPDSLTQLRKYKVKHGSRIRLLRRTLRERRLLASLVRELVAPDLDAFVDPASQDHADAQQDYINLIASLVMVCPNLERLTGLTLPYQHQFDRLTYALSTRRKLREHAWIVADNPDFTSSLQRRAADGHSGFDGGGGGGGGDADDYTYQFLSFHAHWSHLETLMIHSIDTKGRLGHTAYARMFTSLPALKHLTLSHLLPSDFNDNHLIHLPKLTSLRLEKVAGVTEHGLSRFCSYPSALGIESLALIEQAIYSLMLISKLLASLRQLRSFAIAQASVSPVLHDNQMILQPLLSSRSLVSLHWDVKCPNAALTLNDPATIATTESIFRSKTPNALLAQSILHSGFPRLERLRAPQDVAPLGALQCVCRPTPGGRIMLPEDRYSLPRSSRGSLPTNRRVQALPSGNHLTSARIRAQMLIEMKARDMDAGMKIVVTDHSDAAADRVTATQDRSRKLASIFTAEALRADSSTRTGEGPGTKIEEVTVPPVMGRVTYGRTDDGDPPAPHFCLTSDIPRADADGGLVNWKRYTAANQTMKFLAATPPSPVPPISTDIPYGRTSRSSSSAGSLDETLSHSPTSSSPSPATPKSRFSRLAVFSTQNGAEQGTARSIFPSALAPPSPRKFSATSLNASLSPPSFLGQPYWLRDTCKGEWNRQHRGGKDWWQHTERERPSARDGPESLSIGDLMSHL
ncbi:hypothetical protein KEM52_006513 [Ascosphaera acerosa]|nr:hypothetical protein KEM52_006513 [Ascosphaera acerosa]